MTGARAVTQHWQVLRAQQPVLLPGRAGAGVDEPDELAASESFFAAALYESLR